MKIFISYPRENFRDAEKLSISLMQDGHNVFFDQEKLPKGRSYDNLIRRELYKCQLLVFLVTSESIQKGSYSLSELLIFQNRFNNPSGRVLPIMMEIVDYELIPNYLKAVTVLNPVGNLVAEVTATISTISKQRLRTLIIKATILLITIIGLVYSYTITNRSGTFNDIAAENNITDKIDSSDSNTNNTEEVNLNEAQKAEMGSLRQDGKPYRNKTQEAQFLLNALGYEIRFPDGYEGPTTTMALEDFQKKSNIPISGAADDQTLNLLRDRAKKTFLRMK